MVWIHGGGFFMGSGNGESDLFGPNHLMNSDVVLVTMNYRLGALGDSLKLNFKSLKYNLSKASIPPIPKMHRAITACWTSYLH